MFAKKTVYVPRNWKVSFVDSIGNEHKDYNLRANEEYRIVAGGIPYNVTISGIRTEDNKTYVVAKVMMYAGSMNVMEKKADRFDVEEITEITPVSTKYVKTTRSNRDKHADADMFSFAFDTEKYTSQYRISIYAGEFVSLAIKDPTDPNRRSRSIFGHIIDVDDEKNEVVFCRYVTNSGVRDIIETRVNLNSLLGVYRYDLEIIDKEEAATSEQTKTSAEATPVATEE